MIEAPSSGGAFKAPASLHRPRLISERSSFDVYAMERAPRGSQNAEELRSESAKSNHRLDHEPEADGSGFILVGPAGRRLSYSRCLQPKRDWRQISASERRALRESFIPFENSLHNYSRPLDADTTSPMEPLPSPHDAVCGLRMRPHGFFQVQDGSSPGIASYVTTAPDTSMEISVPVVEASPTTTPRPKPLSLPSSPPTLRQKEEFEDASSETMPPEVLLPLF